MNKREDIKKSKRCVIKIGSALLTNDGSGLNKVGIATWAEQISILQKSGVEVVLVSSGAVAEGMCRLGLTKRPGSLHELQAAAAVGQMGLIQSYESAFSKYNLHTAQVLLTHDDLSNRQRYLNARNTVRSLLALGVIPIINENDTVVTDEIRFGDNDTLAALVANLIEADYLVILTDQNGLFDRNPREHADAKLIAEASANDNSLAAMAEGGAGTFGRGGMATKVSAAKLASRSGASTLIAAGKETNVITRLFSGESLGTLLYAEQTPVAARKQWLAGHLQIQGQLIIDDGAVKKLCESGSSLLAVGVSDVRGNFSRGEIVSCVGLNGKEVARGLVNYGANDVHKIKGKASNEIKSILGYVDDAELIHRDNLVLV
ncbi:MAG: glutamate 5-kinase [Gammaproteobacteria bacterium]|nr:glutamate 5-kinase [Gammaproteobacteria bacterium]MCW8986841.1 glutamate 5-kinase [Gammaproteobacteria bacterium]MCW9030095.1 glutamate 5-kinase [Gammaproteobacteria bacterium]